MTGAAPPDARSERDLETAARRGRMVDAAVELAAAGGYESVQMRDVVMRWLRARGGSLSAGRFGDPAQPRWAVAPAPTGTCAAP